MGKTINLIYSSGETNFFEKIGQMREIIHQDKEKVFNGDFNPRDEEEARRGDSYAVFPELQNRYENVQENDSGIVKILKPGMSAISLGEIRNGLETRGVIDKNLQDRVLSLLLQTRGGVHFGVMNVVINTMLENGHQFLADKDYSLNLVVKNPNSIKINCEFSLIDISKNPPEKSFNVNISLDINPRSVRLSNCQITKISPDSNLEANNAFKFLKSNQANIFKKIIMFFKNYFKIDKKIEIENSGKNNKSKSVDPKEYAKVRDDKIEAMRKSSKEDGDINEETHAQTPSIRRSM